MAADELLHQAREQTLLFVGLGDGDPVAVDPWRAASHRLEEIDGAHQVVAVDIHVRVGGIALASIRDVARQVVGEGAGLAAPIVGSDDRRVRRAGCGVAVEAGKDGAAHRAIEVSGAMNLQRARGQARAGIGSVKDSTGIDLQIAVGQRTICAAETENRRDLRIRAHGQQGATPRNVVGQHAGLGARERRLNENRQVVLRRVAQPLRWLGRPDRKR